MESKMRLALDCDSVIFDFIESFNSYIAKIDNPHKAKLNVIPTVWNMWEYMCISKEQWLDYIYRYTIDAGFASGNLIEPEIPQIIKNLAEEHEIIILTARHHGLNGLKRHVVNDTVNWLDKNNIFYHDICFVSKKDCINADILLDDAAHNLEHFSVNGVGIAYDTPYNQMWNGLRVKKWKEFEKLITEDFNKC